ncbi:MAG: hypothetical protein U5K56_05045 [Halioglobus sp.]|nr:hypothetical protein [Halioglobus sp.]
MNGLNATTRLAVAATFLVLSGQSLAMPEFARKYDMTVHGVPRRLSPS